MIVEVLQELLLARGWYLHKWEYLEMGDRGYYRFRIRFPCRIPLDCAFINNNLCTAESISLCIEQFIEKETN